MVVSDVVISMENIAIDYFEYTREKVFSLGKIKRIQAVKNASLKIRNGERVAIIGRNGSGKSTLLRCIAGMLRPASGRLETTGRILFLSGVDPGFDPELTGRENIKQLAVAYGVPKEEIPEFISSVKEFTELGDAYERKFGGYSGGMRGKLGFGFISDLRSDVLLIDETFGAGDREFKKKSRSKMNAMIDEISTVIMCTHGLPLARDICDRGLVMNSGNLVFDGPISDAIDYYEDLTSSSINWVEFPYNKKYVSSEGVSFDFQAEFKVQEDLRLVIHDQRKKKFIIVEELDAGENLFIKRNALPDHLECKFKLQQFREDRWYDASRYIQLTDIESEEE